MPQPVLNTRLKGEITATMIDLPSVWGAKEGDEGREELLRVVSASLEPLLEIKKIELRYSRRMVTAMERRDTAMLMAAVYGLQVDMRGGMSPRLTDDEFIRSMFMRSMRIASHGQIMKWFDKHRYSALGNMRERRALIEYFEDKLAKLDAAVLEKFPDMNEERDAEPAPAPKP